MSYYRTNMARARAPDSRQLADAAAALLAAPAADDPGQKPKSAAAPGRARVTTSSPREFLPKP